MDSSYYNGAFYCVSMLERLKDDIIGFYKKYDDK